jgi:hypothetical protein
VDSADGYCLTCISEDEGELCVVKPASDLEGTRCPRSRLLPWACVSQRSPAQAGQNTSAASAPGCGDGIPMAQGLGLMSLTGRKRPMSTTMRSS